MTTPPLPPPGGKGKGKQGLAKRRPALLYGAAAAAAVVVIALVARARSGSQASGSPGGTTGYADVGTATPYAYGGNPPDYSAQFAAIDNALAQLTARSDTDTTGKHRKDRDRKGGKNVLPTGGRKKKRWPA